MPASQINLTRATPVVSKNSSLIRCELPGASATGTVRVLNERFTQLSMMTLSSMYRR